MAVAPAGSPVVVPVARGCAWGRAFGGALCEEKVVSRIRETENSQESDKKHTKINICESGARAQTSQAPKKLLSSTRDVFFLCGRILSKLVFL